MSDLKITKGEFKEIDRITDGSEFDLVPMIEIGTETKAVAEIKSSLNDDDEFVFTEEDEANAELIKEAFNVTNETGKTPRQLLEQMDDLLLSSIKLAAEVDGLNAFKSEVRDVIGNTNWNILQERMAQLNAVTSKAREGQS